MALRTFSQIVNDLITYILRQNQKIDVSPGQVIRDVAINAPANEMANLYSNIEQIRNAQSILNANIMSTQDMNNLVANFGITRKTATPSQGTVVFYTPTQPISDFEIPAGTVVATSPNNNNPQINFVTLNNVNFVAAFESSYYNSNTGNWEITANIQAQQGGTIGNVGPFTINQVLNFDLPFKVMNTIAITGGTDQENNQDLAIRTINSFLGNNKGTRNGYLGTILSQPNVLDALVQGPGDPLMVRDGNQGGKVDIWTLTNNLSATELNPNNTPSLSFSWNNNAESLLNYEFRFPNLPVDVDSSLLLTATTGPVNPLINVVLYESRNPAPSGIAYINEGDYHYTFYKANDLDTAHSVEANDYIVWNPTTMEQLRSYPSGLNVSNTLQVDVDYSYDKTINDLQTIIDDPNNRIITADVLIKQAIKVTIDVQLNVNLDPSYSSTPNTQTQTVNSIITALTNYINSVKMGTRLQESDIVQVAHNVTGVDNVVLNSIVIIRSINPVYGIAPQQVMDTQAFANEYLETGTITVNVVSTNS